jgi:nucleotide-binding universal stress UspA family protein
MSDENGRQWMADAEQRFDRARRQAFIESVIGQLRGQPTLLLPFDDVRDSLGLVPSSDRGLHEIPLDKIVGSVGRYREFTRSFLPRDDTIRQRWKRIYATAQGMKGLPPIEVYQVGDVFFVKDGNHRVSVAREMGAKTIQAYVREFASPVPISADTRVDELILKSEAARFLQHTSLDERRPQAEIQVTSPGYYDKLEEHIAVHGYFLGLQEQRDVSWQEAVTHWYDHVYKPLIESIRAHDILQEFPGRTETDLYLWIIEHRHFLAQRLGLEIDLTEAARDFATRYSPRWQRVMERAQQSLADAVTPHSMESGPPVGQWRRDHTESLARSQLFADLLVLVERTKGSECAIDQALVLARLERASLYALWIGSLEEPHAGHSALQSAFSQRCESAGVPCRFLAQQGEPARMVAERARWVDLVVMSRLFPEADSAAQPSDAVLQATLRHTAQPILVTTGRCRPLKTALLAYDDSPTSTEALFIAAHIAQHWAIPVRIITVNESRRTSTDTLAQALAYMRHYGIDAEGFFRSGPVAETILDTAAELDVELLVLGASGHSPFVEFFVRSTLSGVLRQARCPVLICH